MEQERIILKVSEIAEALKISRVAVNKRKLSQAWPTVNGSGPDCFDIDEIPLTYKERKICRTWDNRRKGSHLRIVASPAEREAEAAEKERLRLEAREQSLATFSRLPEQQQRGAKAKLEIIKACNNFIMTNKLAKIAGQDAFAHEYSLGRADVAPWVYDEIRDFHPGTLRTWINEEYELGMLGLVDMYGNRKGQSKIETYPPYKERVLALLLDKPWIQPKHVQESLLAITPAGPYVSIKSVDRYIKQWKQDHPQEFALATNPDDYKNRYQAAFGSRSEGIEGPNQLWEIDATPADLLLVDGRHKIIGLIDVGPRRLILQVTRTERAVDNAAVVRRAILTFGVPRNGIFKTDNGTSYSSDHFMRVMDDLDIDQRFCKPFSGDEKPHIERSFHTFSHDLVELMPGFCGHNVSERKAIEARKSFAKRMMTPGEVIEFSMTAEDLQEFCDHWCATYHNQKHSGLGKSPNQALSEWPHPIYTINDVRALDVLLCEAPQRRGKLPTVQKKGIILDKGCYIHPLLADHIGEQVRVLYDPADLGRIIVHTLNEHGVFEFCCIAEDPERTGISRYEVAMAAKARQKEHKAAMAHHAREAKKTLKGVDVVTAVMQYREKQAAETTVSYFPRPTSEHTSAGLVAASQAAAALMGNGKTPIEHSPELQAKRAALATMAETNVEAPQPQQRKVVQLPVKPAGFAVPEGRKERWDLWNELHNRILSQDYMLDEELQFYTSFRQSPTWKSFAMMYNAQ
jgi:hypothetical protein